MILLKSQSTASAAEVLDRTDARWTPGGRKIALQNVLWPELPNFVKKLNFIYSWKTTKFCEISTLLLSFVVPVESKVVILQNFVAFSEYMNFTSHFFILNKWSMVQYGNLDNLSWNQDGDT